MIAPVCRETPGDEGCRWREYQSDAMDEVAKVVPGHIGNMCLVSQRGGGPYSVRKPSAMFIEGDPSRSKEDMSVDCAGATSPPGRTTLEWDTEGCPRGA
jgi:hypothetical protein